MLALSILIVYIKTVPSDWVFQNHTAEDRNMTRAFTDEQLQQLFDAIHKITQQTVFDDLEDGEIHTDSGFFLIAIHETDERVLMQSAVLSSRNEFNRMEEFSNARTARDKVNAVANASMPSLVLKQLRQHWSDGFDISGMMEHLQGIKLAAMMAEKMSDEKLERLESQAKAEQES